MRDNLIKKGTGIDELLDAILVTAEMLELEANPKRYAYGTVLEARLERGEGPKAMLLIQNGTLTNRDFVVAGAAYGKVRRMTNEHNKALKSAGPATPVAIIGLDEVPEAGDNFIAFETEKEAKVVDNSQNFITPTSTTQLCQVKIEEKIVNGHSTEPMITQQIVSCDSNEGGAFLHLKVNVYYKSFWVHSKIDVYYKKQNTWYLDKIDVTKKTSAARGIALDNLMTDYITKRN